MNATILGTFTENGCACLAVAVIEVAGRVEYIGRVPMDAAWAAMTATQQKAALVAAVKAVRNAEIATPAAPPAMSGSTTL